MEAHLEFIDFQKVLGSVDLTEDYIANTIRIIDGVQEIRFTQAGIGVKFNRYIISKSDIVRLMEELGYSMMTSSKKSGLLRSFIDKLAKSNIKNFGNQKLDCCDLNKQ